jgi:mRNA interferase RelE/StbE
MKYKYKLKFLSTALKEWKKLDHSIKSQLKKKLKERLHHPICEQANCMVVKTITK